uniref:Tubulin polymerization-promoting protein family member 2 n=1 Tax=Lygus hesperus TaxID=30085 RepID=A0A0A9YXF4_LYGHE
MPENAVISSDLKALYEELYKVYTRYCQLGNHHTTTHLDSRSWKKLVMESGLLGGTYTRNDIDLTFVRVRTRQSNTINFEQFLQALDEVAHRSHNDINQVIYKVCSFYSSYTCDIPLPYSLCIHRSPL